MTKADQREIWALKMRHPEMRHIPDAVFFVIMERAKYKALVEMAKRSS